MRSAFEISPCPSRSEFQEIVARIYPENHPRLKLGHDPVDEHLLGLYLVKQKAKTVARFALYNNEYLVYKGKKVLCIGSFEAENKKEIMDAIIPFAKEKCKELRAGHIIGPMEGSTWNSYRFMDDCEKEPFFMENAHHCYYRDLFIHSGFTPLASYESTEIDLKTFPLSDVKEMEAVIKSQGGIIRHFDLQDAEEELRRIADFSNEAFQENFLFSPIDRDVFAKKYLAYLPYFDPKYIWLLENNQHEIQGLVFAMKDHLNLTEEVLIVKSMARRKTNPMKGLGRFLHDRTLQIAIDNGFKKIIHAYMIETGASNKISIEMGTSLYREYSLLAYQL